jgi:hypothetical protein
MGLVFGLQTGRNVAYLKASIPIFNLGRGARSSVPLLADNDQCGRCFRDRVAKAKPEAGEIRRASTTRNLLSETAESAQQMTCG